MRNEAGLAVRIVRADIFGDTPRDPPPEGRGLEGRDPDPPALRSAACRSNIKKKQMFLGTAGIFF